MENRSQRCNMNRHRPRHGHKYTKCKMHFGITKKLYGRFLWMLFNFLKVADPLLGESLVSTIKCQEISCTHLIDLEKLTLNPPSGFEPGTRGLRILRLKPLDLMVTCMEQYLCNIWSSIHENVKQHWGWVEKKCYL